MIIDEFEFQKITSEPELVNRFLLEHKKTVSFCPKTERWKNFNGIGWEKSPKKLPQQTTKLRKTLEGYFNEYLPQLDSKQKQKFHKVITSFKSARGAKKILDTVSTYVEVQVPEDKFNDNPELLVVANGTIDLKTGTLRDSKPEEYMTTMASTKYNPSKSCPKFEVFLDEISNNSLELKNYILSILGYCLTGLTKEQDIYVFYGMGANGKTLLIEVIRDILGDLFVVNINSRSLMRNKLTLREDIARVSGARIITCSEINEGETMDESLVKSLTGGDKITGRPLFSNSFEFKNTGKIITSTNFLFEIKGVDYGIYRRLKIIPFSATFKGDNENKNLKAILLEEKEGILALLVEHAIKYVQNGTIEVPEEVKTATDNYIKSSNSGKMFYQDCVTNTKERKLWLSLRQMYESYDKYCEDNCLKKLSPRELTTVLKTLGAKQKKIDKNRYWENLTINSVPFITNLTNPIITLPPQVVSISEEETTDSQKESENIELESDSASISLGESNDAHELESDKSATI